MTERREEFGKDPTRKEVEGRKKTVGKPKKSSAKALLGSSRQLRLLKMNEKKVLKPQTVTGAQITKTSLRWKNDKTQDSKGSEHNLSQEIKLLK